MRNALAPGAFALLLSALADRAIAVDYNANICGDDVKHQSGDGKFVFQPNAWSAVGETGFQCMMVDESIPAFDAPWRWVDDPTNVHSYPHVRFASEKLPTRMDAIKSLNLATQWTMRLGLPGDDPPRDFSNETWATQKAAILDRGIVANAAWDFFADVNKTRTYNPVDADTEIMIWIGLINNPFPLKGPKVLTTMTLSGTEFELNYAKNFRNHSVFTWTAAQKNDVTDFRGDVAPLLKYILDSGLIPKESWLGLVEFGTETWYSPTNVTFSAAHFSMEIDTGDFDNKPAGGSGGSGNTGGNGGGNGNPPPPNAGSALASSGAAMLGAAVMMGVAMLAAVY